MPCDIQCEKAVKLQLLPQDQRWGRKEAEKSLRERLGEASDVGRQRRGANSRGRLTLGPSSDHLVTMKEVIFSSMD